jgi:ankyrin repeat protein
VLDLNWKDSAGPNDQTALSYAASRGYTDVVRLFLEKDGVDLNTMDKNKQTPLS